MSDDITATVLDLIAEAKRVPRESLGIDTTFEQLEIDSLDAVNLIYEIEERFNISVPDHAFRSIKNVRELIDQLQKILAASASSQISPS